MTPNDELTAGPSGFQFIYGDYYAQSGKYAEWLEMNKKWLSTRRFPHGASLEYRRADVFRTIHEEQGCRCDHGRI